jgi:hypothetical protein
VPPRFDKDKSVSEFFFGIRAQHFLHLAMTCIPGGGQNAQINDTLSCIFNKDKRTKISALDIFLLSLYGRSNPGYWRWKA